MIRRLQIPQNPYVFSGLSSADDCFCGRNIGGNGDVFIRNDVFGGFVQKGLEFVAIASSMGSAALHVMKI